MSCHKFASNVCEKALLHSELDVRRALVDELIDVKPDGTNNVGMLLRDSFGNFPLQVSELRDCLPSGEAHGRWSSDCPVSFPCKSAHRGESTLGVDITADPFRSFWRS